MTHVMRHPILLVLAGILVPALVAAQTSATTTLAVAGRSNATPSIAAIGRFVVVAWGASTPDGKTDVFAATSRDAGATFSTPVRVNDHPGEARLGGELPPRVALVPARSGEPVIAVLWTAKAGETAIKIARSTDGGRTFARGASLQQAGAAGDRGWQALALDSRGNTHAIWLDHRGLAADPAAPDSHKQHGAAAQHDGVAMAQKSGLYYSDGTRERSLTNGVCYCCKTALAVGPRDTLFAAWRHVYPGNLRDIAVTMSRDGGRTFSAPARASEDQWAIDGCPDDGPALVVDASGTAHMVWPTVIGGAEPRGAIFYTSTRDGRTFTKRLQVPTLGSLKPSHPQIAVDDAGGLLVAWDESIEGRRVAAVRRISPAANTLKSGDATQLDAGRAATYPVIAAVPDGFIAAWTSGAGDASMIRVRRLPSEPLAPQR